MKKIILNSLLISSLSGLCYGADENINSSSINFFASANYFELYPIDNKPAPDGEITGDRQYIVLGTVGLQLLPESLNIYLSYSGALSTSESWVESDEWMAYNEGEKDMSIISVYSRPLSTSYGALGFGYNKYKFSSAIWAEGSATAVDITSNGSAITLSGNTAEARYQAEITDYYITYTLPNDISYIPNGLGIKVGIEESNYPKMIENGYFAMHPETTSTYYGIGINKQFDDLEDGFSFKTLMISKSNNTHKYHNYVDNTDNELSNTSTQFDIEIAYNIITKNKKQFYIMPNFRIKTHSDSEDEYKQGGVEIGLIY